MPILEENLKWHFIYFFISNHFSQTSVEEHLNSAMISLNQNNSPEGCDSLKDKKIYALNFSQTCCMQCVAFRGIIKAKNIY